MRFGRQVTLSRDGDVTKVHEKLFVEYAAKKDVCCYTETKRVRNMAHALAEFLSLQDRAKKEDIHNIGVQFIEDSEGNVCRVELSWQVFNLP